jgi:hypothetical protein
VVAPPSHARDRVVRTLAREGVEGPPRGELFLSREVLDYWFPGARGDYVSQLSLAADLLEFSAVGADLNGEEAGPFLGEGRFAALREYFTIGCVNGPMSRIIEDIGFFKAMVQMKKDPEGFLARARAVKEGMGRTCALARANGMSAIAVADDIAGNRGLLFSFDDFAANLLPVYAEIAGAIKDNGLYAFFHCDGNTSHIIDSLIGAGYDCIHPVDGQAGMNIRELTRVFGERVSFMGHIDAVAWGPQKVREERKWAKEKMGAGGLILGSSGGISRGTVTKGLTALYPKLQRLPADR